MPIFGRERPREFHGDREELARRGSTTQRRFMTHLCGGRALFRLNSRSVQARGEDHLIDPTSPTTLKHSNSSSSSSSGSSTSRRKSRGHKERDSTYRGLYSQDLACMLIEEGIQTSDSSKWAQTPSYQLSRSNAWTMRNAGRRTLRLGWRWEPGSGWNKR